MPLPVPSRRLSAVALALAWMTACAHGGPSGLPLPPGWDEPEPSQSGWPSARPPLTWRGAWGVPAFEPPSAQHCRRPPRLREQAGGPGRHWEAERAEAMRRRGAAEPWAGKGEAGDRAAADSGSRPHATLAAPRASEAEAPAPGPAARAPGDDAAALADHEAGAPATDAAPAAASEAGSRPPMQEDSHEAPGRDASGAGVAGSQRYRQPSPARQHRPVVTAGMVDDNADFGEFLSFLERRGDLELRWRDVAERYRVEVRDAEGRPVPDAEIALAWPGGRSVVWARSDAAGTAWLHPRAILPPQADGHDLEVQVRSAGTMARALLRRGQKANVPVRLPSAVVPQRPRLDLVFLVDATGSMGDEIAKLKASLRTIADRIDALPGQPETCFGLVAYRDHGDAFLTRTLDFTDRLYDFQAHLGRLQAGGGGDMPEALHEALQEVVHGLSWRGAGATRIVVLLGDAPPHLNDGSTPYDDGMVAAVAKGIKLHAVGASGLDRQGEAVFRQMAQYTGGRFVFLTYRHAHRPRSGPGSETVHDVRNYSVDTLDELIVRLVREELGRLPAR